MDTANKLLAQLKTNDYGNLLLWGGFLTASLFVYYFISSGDFSFLLTYASFMRCFAFAILNYKMWSSRTAKGVSVKTLQLYAVVFVARLLSIFRHQGYLPYDKSGDWFYHAVEVLSLLSVCLGIYGMLGPLKSTYDDKFDKFGNLHIPNEFGAVYLFVPAVVLAMIFHPSLNHEFFSDVMWTLSMYLESAAMVPQLYMFQKQASDEKGAVEILLGHTVFALSFSRVFELIFWVSSFKELSSRAGSPLTGYLVLATQVGQLAVMGDFFYYYIKALSGGVPMELPTAANNYCGNV